MNDNSHTNDGAELVFHGRVRDSENGQQIQALFYEHYENMAEQELQKLAEKTTQLFNINDLYCIHRIGKIPVGEISMRVCIWSGHRKEGLAAMDWFITELKKHVPIWKAGILPDGTKIQSAPCKHD